MNRLQHSSLYQLTRIRFLLVWREPEAIFWIFIFPILLAVGLGIAFRNRPPDVLPVAATSAQLTRALGRRQWTSRHADGRGQRESMRWHTGAILLLAVEQPGGVTYQYDDTNPDARTARLLADRAMQAAAGQREAVPCEQRSGTRNRFALHRLCGAGPAWNEPDGLGDLGARLRHC